MLGIANFTNSQVSWLNSFHVVALETQNDSQVSWFSLARISGEHAGLGDQTDVQVSGVKFENAQLR